MSIDINEYDVLNSSPVSIEKEKTAPEDEFFHSIYVPGVPRKNHINIDEVPGKLQIRGVEYNLDKLHMIILHIKNTLVKSEMNQSSGREEINCFSFQEEGDQSKGTSGRFCGRNRAERNADPYCVPCRSQLIVTGVYCDEFGNPKLKKDKDGKNNLIYVFIKSKGLRYTLAFDYINELVNIDPVEIGPILDVSNPKNLAFEKKIINSKRFVTDVTVTTVQNKKGATFYSPKMTKGKKIEFSGEDPKQSHEKLLKQIDDYLKLSKRTYDALKEKFDLSSSVRSGVPNQNYKPENFTPETGETFNIPDSNINKQNNDSNNISTSSDFNFDDIKFGE